MQSFRLIAIVTAALVLAACEKTNKTIDIGINTHSVSQLKAGIWIDPQGCDQWIIDDGVEGYLSARLDKYGKPVCSGIAAPTQTVGKFKNWVPDPL
ncbi:MAG: hypothetical protein GXP05_12245 [Alphaproteobacteria bacterium]|nr:hypothetical protein [Alphaproteobacteria bacterium]